MDTCAVTVLSQSQIGTLDCWLLTEKLDKAGFKVAFGWAVLLRDESRRMWC